jgi:hypothetical protein
MRLLIVVVLALIGAASLEIVTLDYVGRDASAPPAVTGLELFDR